MARVVCFSQPILVMISSKVVPPSRLSIAITWLVLLPSRGAPASFVVAATGAFFARVAFFFAPGSDDATSGDSGAPMVDGAGSVDSGMPASGWAVLLAPCPATGTVAGTGAGSSAAAGPVWPRVWIAFQIRDTAVTRSLNLRTGVSPGRLFQISASRAAGQFAASFANAPSLLNRSEFGTVSASFAELWMVMLFVSFSIVKCFIFRLLVRHLPRSAH